MTPPPPPFTLQELERKHGEEVERLTRKLKWYAENQELLDKSTRTIRSKDEEIHKLKLRIEELQTEVLWTHLILNCW